MPSVCSPTRFSSARFALVHRYLVLPSVIKIDFGYYLLIPGCHCRRDFISRRVSPCLRRIQHGSTARVYQLILFKLVCDMPPSQLTPVRTTHDEYYLSFCWRYPSVSISVVICHDSGSMLWVGSSWGFDSLLISSDPRCSLRVMTYRI